jgi:hypothetical protein
MQTYREEKQNALPVSTEILHLSLKRMGISTANDLVEKSEIVELFAVHRVHKRILDEKMWDDTYQKLCSRYSNDDSDEPPDSIKSVILAELTKSKESSTDRLKQILRGHGVDPAPYQDKFSLALEATVYQLLVHSRIDSRDPERWWQEELERSTADLTPLQLREKLFSEFKIDSRNLRGKDALVEAFGKALKEKQQQEAEQSADDDMADRPLLGPARDPPLSGAFLSPAVNQRGWMSLTYAFLDHDGTAVRRIAVMYRKPRAVYEAGKFREGSKLIPGGPGRMWVHCPAEGGRWGLRHCTEIGLDVDRLYDMTEESQIVTDQDDGVWRW